jgi:hypothetical protein
MSTFSSVVPFILFTSRVGGVTFSHSLVSDTRVFPASLHSATLNGTILLSLFPLAAAVLPREEKTAEPITKDNFLRGPIPVEDAFFRKGNAGPILRRGSRVCFSSLRASSGPSVFSWEIGGAPASHPPCTRNSRSGGCDAQSAMGLALAMVGEDRRLVFSRSHVRRAPSVEIARTTVENT